MKVKIAGFKILPYKDSPYTTIMDHEPTHKDFLRVTEWVEVELPMLDKDAIELAASQNTDAAVAELEKRIAALRSAKQAQAAA